MKITDLKAREILDSRGVPTIETRITLGGGQTCTGSVPGGASTGTHEAVELRDNDPTRYNGKGVLKAVENVNKTIASRVVGENIISQKELDDALIQLDNTENKANLGANAILSVSMAFCRASAMSENLALYKYIQKISKTDEIIMPQLSILIMEGGKHGNWSTDFQEYMIIPKREMFHSVSESIQAGSEVFWAAHDILVEKGYSATVGLEGAFAPQEIRSNTEAFEIILAAIEKAGYTPEDEIVLGIDAAASEFFSDNIYDLKREGKQLSTEDWIDLLVQWCSKYPIWSLEDPLDEEDWEGWRKLTAMVGGSLQVIGDDLLVTNTERIQKAIDSYAANSVLIKMNQIGTVSETLNAIALADQGGFSTMVSHRSGETNDDFIADLVVGTTSRQTKFGGPDRGERLAKYNRLMAIEEEVGP